VNFVVAFGVSRLTAPPPTEVAELLDFLHEPSTLRPKASSGTAN